MGASILGGGCARAIWYNFRWATASNFSGRILRLFNRGHMEEARFIALLLMIGCEVYQQDENGKQFRISHEAGHIGGSGDGVVIGLPDLPPGTAVLIEAKTHNDKSFKDLAGDNWQKYIDHFIDPNNNPPVPFKGKGVHEAKLEHYVQSNIYMTKMGLGATLYLAVNKNTDELYAELIPANPESAARFLDRGSQLVRMELPPEKINASPGFWKCRFCDHRPVCHLKQAPDRNCRTCEFSKPNAEDKGWSCAIHGAIDVPTQLKGCTDYQVKPGF